MKIKLLILFILIWVNSFAQKLPITGLCWSDVFTATNTSCSPDAWVAANPAYFDPAYAVSGDCLDDWRNYGTTNCDVSSSLLFVISYAPYGSGDYVDLTSKSISCQAMYDIYVHNVPKAAVNFYSSDFAVGSNIYAMTTGVCDLVNSRYTITLPVTSATGDLVYHIVDGVIVSKESCQTLPTVTTTSITSITSTTATSGGNVTADGGASVTARGVCWNTSTNPTTANSHTADGTGTGSFTSSLTGLTAGTAYYVRAYATNSAGTAYGSNVSFTTDSWIYPCGATLTTNTVTPTTTTTATGGGNVTGYSGQTPPGYKGICYGTSPNPTLSGSYTQDGGGTGSFTSTLTGLTPGTFYYARAYTITASSEVCYGNEVTFISLSPCQKQARKLYYLVHITTGDMAGWDQNFTDSRLHACTALSKHLSDGWTMYEDGNIVYSDSFSIGDATYYGSSTGCSPLPLDGYYLFSHASTSDPVYHIVSGVITEIITCP